MTNFERYKYEIMKIIESGSSCCIAVKDGKPVRCESMLGCDNCELNTEESNCGFKFLKWAYEDDDEGRDCGDCKHYDEGNTTEPCRYCKRCYIDKFEPKPKKTRQDEFLKLYPNARLNSKGILDIRPCNIDTSYSTDHCYFACGDECQNAYWSQEVDE